MKKVEVFISEYPTIETVIKDDEHRVNEEVESRDQLIAKRKQVRKSSKPREDKIEVKIRNETETWTTD